jgi:Na+/H+-dicarboxylate symporter
MKRIVQEFVGILGAFIAWWALAVMIGLLMYAIFPPTTSSFGAGVSFEPQNVPGNVAGFIAALYAFRAIAKRPNEDD